MFFTFKFLNKDISDFLFEEILSVKTQTYFRIQLLLFFYSENITKCTLHETAYYLYPSESEAQSLKNGMKIYDLPPVIFTKLMFLIQGMLFFSVARVNI